MTGIDVSGQVIVLEDLEAQLEAGGVSVPYGLSIVGPSLSAPQPPHVPNAPPSPCVQGSVLFTYDAQGNPAELPPAAVSIVDTYSPPLGRSAPPPSAAHEQIAAATDLEQLKTALLEAIP